MPEDISGISGDLPHEKRKSVCKKDQRRIKLKSTVLILSYTPRLDHGYLALEHKIENIGGIHGRGIKCSGNKTGLLPFPELQFSRGELHFAFSFCYSVCALRYPRGAGTGTRIVLIYEHTHTFW
jgi:hypothetical protein